MGRVFAFLLGVILVGIGLSISDASIFPKVGALAPYVGKPISLGAAELYRPVIAIVVGGLGGLVALGALFGHRTSSRGAVSVTRPQPVVAPSDSFSTEPPPEPAPFPTDAVAAPPATEAPVTPLVEPGPFPGAPAPVAEAEPAPAVVTVAAPQPVLEDPELEIEPESVVQPVAASPASPGASDVWVWMTPDSVAEQAANDSASEPAAEPAGASETTQAEAITDEAMDPISPTVPSAEEAAVAPPESTMEAESFEAAREKLRELARDENWPAVAGVLGRLHRLAATPTEHALAAQDLGTFHRAQGKTDEAAEAYETALYYAREVSPPDPALLCATLTDVGDVAMDESRLDLAVASYGELVDLRRAQAAADPSPDSRRMLSLALERLGDAREDRGHRTRALELYRESLVIADDLAATDPARYATELEITRGRVAELEALLA